jgi:hypothetical protein
MAAKKIIAQPDILDLESLGAFMTHSRDPVGKKAHRRLLHKYCLRQDRQKRSHIPR